MSSLIFVDVLNEFRKIPEKMDFIQSWFKGFEDGITRLKHFHYYK